jgi:CelD/BcsL family acetyltransferase involved in cellulose biosynthesis
VTRCGERARLEALGVRDLDEPSDLLFAHPAALAELAEALAALAQPLWLPRLPADSPSVAALQRAFRGRGLVYRSAAPSYPRIPLDADWTEPERHFNAGRRSDFRRAERRAAAWGPLRYEILSPTPAEVPPLLDAMYRVEAACWKGRVGGALGCDEARGAFFRRYAPAAAARGILRLCFLRVGGQPAAVQLAVECGQRYWLLKIGYDEQFARCSPGALLLLQTLRYAATRGLRSYEFLGTSQPWTRMWTDRRQECVALRAYPWRARAVATLARDAARYAGIRLQRVLDGAA